MSRLIPGRVRNEGIGLFESGLVKFKEQDGQTLRFQVEGHNLSYSSIDEEIDCDCEFFSKKGYCEHLAAVEAYLKQTSEGQELGQSLEEEQAHVNVERKEHTFGSLFLDGLAINEDDHLRYRIAAVGELSPFSGDIWWTLKINRLPDARSYVVRDIKAFLSTIRKESYLQIGKNYYEPVSFLQFDEASQALISFLWRLIPDGERIDWSYLLPEQHRFLALPSGFFEEGVNYLSHLYDFHLTIGNLGFSEVRFKSLESKDELFAFKVLVHRRELELIVTEKNCHSFYGGNFLWYLNTFYHLSSKQFKLMQALRSLPIGSDLAKHVLFDLEDQAKLAASLLDFKELGPVDAPKVFNIQEFEVSFFLEQNGPKEIGLQMIFDYGNIKVSSREELNQLPFTSHFKKEETIIRTLRELGFGLGFSSRRHFDSEEAVYHFFNHDIERLKRLGQVLLSEELQELYRLVHPKVTVTRQGGLLDVSFDFSGVAEADVNQALDALLANEDYFVSTNGQILVFDDETKKVSQTLQNLRAKRSANGHLNLSQLAVYQVSEALSSLEEIEFSQDFEQLVYDLAHPESFDMGEVTVQATLRDYQTTGIKWLSMLDHYGFGGILADDMGLGKTLQTIAFLTAKLTVESKVLILAPSSLIYNWKDEFTKFSPDLDVVVSYGLKDQRDRLIAERHQVVITSYASFRQDFELYSQDSYDYLILDEAQVMKNSQTKIAQALREFDVKHCFALSGTPIENKLLEIWSIFQIVLPGLLPSKKDFLKLDAEAVARYIRPFILRRKKEDVLPELPDLIEMTYPNELAEEQKAIYLAQLRQMQDSIRQSSSTELNRRKIEILSGITRLRQICDTPNLFMDYDGPSGKLESLRQLLLQIKENGHRALIFSQFTGMLAIVEDELANLDMTSYKITGSTPANERQEMTRAFNKGSRDTFLISLKAGGVGLNLTGADTVVLIDLWWNPAVEMQAISRAHRIGQKENVEVYRLITKGTIEEKILELQESKKNLVTTVLDGNETRASLSIDDIKEILGLTDD
ncbi:SNF2-related protein [Streptococcus caprae]|uniref:SNF2-related protein n=1 Tax=Streptococcus caprae TaxID=1640501 RepID=A0ABV8CXG9_9STRE